MPCVNVAIQSIEYLYEYSTISTTMHHQGLWIKLIQTFIFR